MMKTLPLEYETQHIEKGRGVKKMILSSLLIRIVTLKFVNLFQVSEIEHIYQLNSSYQSFEMISNRPKTYGSRKLNGNHLKKSKTLSTLNSLESIMDKLNSPYLFLQLQLISNKMLSFPMTKVKYNNVSFLKLVDKYLV